MHSQGLVRSASIRNRRGNPGRPSAVVPLVGWDTQAPCHRRRWWHIDRLFSGGSGAAPAMRAPAPLLKGLTARTDPSASTSWFVGTVPLGKRALDLTLIALSLPVLIPVFLITGAFIKIVSPGPVFFTQQRVGYRERRFRILKFRSMKVNAETSTHAQHTTFLFKSDKPMEKMDHVDPRLIPYAWILRSTGIDELPQLINVLKGEMSLVGPRPCTTYEHEVMLPWHKRRFEVLPGLTGLWQVSGKNRTTFQQMINFDVAYARRWSAWLDLRIMFRTFPVLLAQFKEMMVKKRGANSPSGPAEAAAA